MDFFAQAYSAEPESDTTVSKDSSKNSTRCAGQGYGCESNSHLRRASSGLEADLGQKRFHGFSHHAGQDHNTVGSPSMKNSHQRNERSHMYINTTAAAASHEAKAVEVDCSFPCSPSLNRRTSVSNPCLLHHTNSNGSGSVRPPVMPRTLGSPHTSHGSARLESQASPKDRLESDHGRSFSAVHEPTIAENPKSYF